MVGHGGSSAGSYLADPTSPIPSHCASIVVTSTLRVKLTYTWLIYHTTVDIMYVTDELQSFVWQLHSSLTVNKVGIMYTSDEQ